MLATADEGSLFGLSRSEALTIALLIGLVLYAGWTLGVDRRHMGVILGRQAGLHLTRG